MIFCENIFFSKLFFFIYLYSKPKKKKDFKVIKKFQKMSSIQPPINLNEKIIPESLFFISLTAQKVFCGGEGVFEVKDPTIATVSQDGTVTPTGKSGITQITCSNASNQTTIMVSLPHAPVETLPPLILPFVKVGQHLPLETTVNGIWISSNQEVAMVTDNNYIVGKQPGVASIIRITNTNQFTSMNVMVGAK
jgi:hypothetical protein